MMQLENAMNNAWCSLSSCRDMTFLSSSPSPLHLWDTGILRSLLFWVSGCWCLSSQAYIDIGYFVFQLVKILALLPHGFWGPQLVERRHMEALSNVVPSSPKDNDMLGKSDIVRETKQNSRIQVMEQFLQFFSSSCLGGRRGDFYAWRDKQAETKLR